ncbi:hypothetical protein DMUE_5338 [Dictyocoela muelleri]|nr:hypothetical protein DMUE_5338 [Dictyocoela muelleri]
MFLNIIFVIADPISLLEISKENDDNYAIFRINDNQPIRSCEMVRKTVKNSDNWKTHVDFTSKFLKKSKKNNGIVKIKLPKNSNSNYFYAFRFQDVNGDSFVTDSKYLNSYNEFKDEREIDIKSSSVKDDTEDNCQSPWYLTFILSFLVIIGIVVFFIFIRWMFHRN